MRYAAHAPNTKNRAMIRRTGSLIHETYSHEDTFALSQCPDIRLAPMAAHIVLGQHEFEFDPRGRRDWGADPAGALEDAIDLLGWLSEPQRGERVWEDGVGGEDCALAHKGVVCHGDGPLLDVGRLLIDLSAPLRQREVEGEFCALHD